MIRAFDVVSGIFFLNDTIQCGTGLYSVDTVAWGLARVILTTVLNIVLAILITGRLLFFRRSLRRALGTSQALSVPYISVAAMVIESSMICALSFLAFAIPYALNSHATNIFFPSSCIMPVRRKFFQVFRYDSHGLYFRFFPPSSSTCESHRAVLGTREP